MLALLALTGAREMAGGSVDGGRDGIAMLPRRVRNPRESAPLLARIWGQFLMQINVENHIMTSSHHVTCHVTHLKGKLLPVTIVFVNC